MLTKFSPGAYDYQKAQVGGVNYEIECHVGAGSGNSYTIGTMVPTLEQCIAQCNAFSANVPTLQAGNFPNGCLSLQWDSRPAVYSCTLYSAVLAEPTFNTFVRSARILNSNYPLIDDQQYLLPNQSLYNIGICGGSGLSAYAGTRINPQDLNGLYQNSNSDFWNECGGKYYQGTASISVANMVSALNTAGYNYNTPASADDCLRFCAISALSSTYSGGSACRGYQWDITNTCTLVTGAGSSVSNNASIVAAGRWQGAGFLPTDTPAGYKLRARQTGSLRNS